MNNMKSTWVCY